MKYRTILADPPWHYYGLSKSCGGISDYITLALEELEEYCLEEFIEDNAHLYLWIVNSQIDSGLKLLNHWGFRYVTMLTWLKTYKNGEPIMGLGRYFRSCTEHVLFGVRGSLKLLNKQERNFFTAPISYHSRKPDVLYEIIERASPGPYLELFARSRRENWHVWGDQIDSDIVISKSI